MPGVNTGFYPAMKAGVWPLVGTANVTVFDWIVMHVIEMPLEILFDLDRMFPKAGPPFTTLTDAVAQQRPRQFVIKQSMTTIGHDR